LQLHFDFKPTPLTIFKIFSGEIRPDFYITGSFFYTVEKIVGLAVFTGLAVVAANR
jgi:hypothetical protein